MLTLDQVTDLLISNKEVILIGASAVVIIDFLVKAAKSGAAITSTLLVFILKRIFWPLIKPVLLGLLWLIMGVVELTHYILDKQKLNRKS